MKITDPVTETVFQELVRLANDVARYEQRREDRRKDHMAYRSDRRISGRERRVLKDEHKERVEAKLAFSAAHELAQEAGLPVLESWQSYAENHVL